MSYGGGSRLKNQQVLDLDSVFVIVDSTKLNNIHFGQLADYIGLTGFAEIHLDDDLENAPTILQLFKDANKAPQEGMSPWDHALLRSLYVTAQASVVEFSEVQSRALDYISSTPGK